MGANGIKIRALQRKRWRLGRADEPWGFADKAVVYVVEIGQTSFGCSSSPSEAHGNETTFFSAPALGMKSIITLLILLVANRTYASPGDNEFSLEVSFGLGDVAEDIYDQGGWSIAVDDGCVTLDSGWYENVLW